MDARSTPLSAGERLEIGTELRRAADAIAIGNDGKARVCARRAAGVALRAWHRARGNAGAPADAQSLLKAVSPESGLPAEAVDAAGRLSASVAAAGSAGAGAVAAGSRATTDPIADARIIIAAVEASPGNADPHAGPSAAGYV
jgi:hypothetical protein